MEFIRLWTRKLLKRRSLFKSNFLLLMLVTIPLVVSSLLVNSMIDGMTAKLIALGSSSISFTADSTETKPVSDLSIDRTVSSYALVYSQTGATSVMIEGVEEGFFNSLRSSRIKIDGEIPADGTCIMISSSMSRKLGIKKGESVAFMLLSNPDPGSVSFNAKVRPAMFTVSGIYETGYSELDDYLVFAAYSDMVALCNPQTATWLYLEEENDIDKLTEIAVETVAENPVIIDYSLWNEANTSVYSNFVNSKQMITLVFAVIALVGCFFSSNVSHEIINDNFAEISVMRIVGAGEKEVKKALFSGIAVTVVAAVSAGTVAGIGLSYLILPVLRALSATGFSGLDMYLLDFTITFSFMRILLIWLLMCLCAALCALVSLKRDRKFSALELLQKR